MKINDLKVFKRFIKVNYYEWYPISSIKCISLHNQYNTLETDIMFNDGTELTVYGSAIHAIKEIDKAKTESSYDTD